MTCRECRWFESTQYKNWGLCIVPIPAWLAEAAEGAQVKNMVWVMAGKRNYAPECECYEECAHELPQEGA